VLGASSTAQRILNEEIPLSGDCYWEVGAGDAFIRGMGALQSRGPQNVYDNVTVVCGSEVLQG